jgi:hypothetical protein
MKITLEFTDEERNEARTAMDASAWRGAMQELDEWLRSKLKYAETTKDAHKAFDETRQELHALLAGHGLELYE